ncbi:hypothetical protein PHYBLDRAFT_179983 [Phycomyces blakesleeanus NRRL 1555(-)]|uniref:Mediator of RNA polymerase II transcription subunit 11 n=1 Tax=Phycomyces blakesleeanus (strain ATCC 8743b / DSM 1359 / FGSC 10004 / NBRC 33097 / NRRL 1555) TaxID=763407 RepID=A0A163B1J5_PHYB8|nr:hypothetical protein PHYBLDRAFT_179983 [Phycomyces blakesleeanus NRRL 1555(-)]OAD77771.1 hypothetical protein PHYBLDRAFT_179983 [Phycomyces blakesleeanus NRRL 1555(-)]|eukprot:XP_018295811.1 hypothetical protein PHYBLDRAFT_179983 [Phycomyces blakesleeanus NRRL 1555(-)]
MTSKATQEYRASFITLISQLTVIEKKGQEFFDRIENSVWTPYVPTSAQTDFEQLMISLQNLETHARTSGLLSIAGSSTDAADGQSSPQPKNLAVRDADTLQAVDTFFQEKNRLLMNIRAAVNAAHRPS